MSAGNGPVPLARQREEACEMRHHERRDDREGELPAETSRQQPHSSTTSAEKT